MEPNTSLVDAYTAAFAEWEESDVAVLWDCMSADGVAAKTS
ncbi:hypothetical protein [Rathayibacter soli]|nr:hypothetical protein [Glaciibacter superstes]